VSRIHTENDDPPTIETPRIRNEAKGVFEIKLNEIPTTPDRRYNDDSSLLVTRIGYRTTQTSKFAHLTLKLFHTTDFDFVSHGTEHLANPDTLSVIGSDHANLVVSCRIICKF
jgi:hypothetical protein